MKQFKLAAMAAVLGTTVAVAGCSSTPPSYPDLTSAQQQLDGFRQDANVANYAPVQLREAERAVNNASQALQDKKDPTEINHLIYMAKGKLALTQAEAERRGAEERAKQLARDRDATILDARTREAAMLREELNAKKTDRGMVITLGDVLFATGQATLQPGARANLDKLVQYLNEYSDRTVSVEGHTDSTGSDAINRRLSQDRADAVKGYLTSRGIAGSRVTAVGKSQDYPVASNSTAEGRQQNRRVEIIISQ